MYLFINMKYTWEMRIISNSLESITKDATLWINMVEPAWAV